MSTARPVPFKPALSAEAGVSIWVRLMRLIGVDRQRAAGQVAATAPNLKLPSLKLAGRVAALSSEGVPPGAKRAIRVHGTTVTKTKRRAQAAARRPGLPGRWKASDRVGPNIRAI